MGLTATHISKVDACVAARFLQAMEARNFPTWMYVGGNGGDVLAAAAANVTDLGAPHVSAKHSAQAQAGEKSL